MKIALGAVFLGAVVLAAWLYWSRRGPRPQLAPTTPQQLALAAALKVDVEALAGLGPRNLFRPEALEAAARHIERSFETAGYRPSRHTFEVGSSTVSNIDIEIAGTSAGTVVIGAHYDSVPDSPGADDNASGVAALLAMARHLAGARPAHTIRLVAFVNEEPPFFTTPDMGSLRYAERLRQRGETVAAMLSIETIGYYSDQPGSQTYPAGLGAIYPTTADFVAIVGNRRSRHLVKRVARAFRASTDVPAETASLPEGIAGVGWSDHWSFWRSGWPAVMVTDTALFRNPHYHRPSDRPGTLDYDRLGRVVEGLQAVAAELAGARP